MSTRMTSGRSARACRSASAMLEATPTTATPSRSRKTLAASRKAWLSSTSRHRSGIPSGCQRYGAAALRLAGTFRPTRSSGFEEPEHRQHPPVIGVAFRQVELGQDAADVLLDRALGDEDPARDARIGRTLRHQGEHLALPR